MGRRNELHGLVRNLRQYLQWQAVPLTGTRPAPDEERSQWQQRKEARDRARLDAALNRTQSPEPAAEAPSGSPKKNERPAKESGSALWKSKPSRQRRTFGSSKTPPDQKTSETSGETLDEVREELGECTRCGLCESRTNIVFGVGSENARLMFIGEAPGFNEDKEGEPFVGKAGALLDKMIGAMTLSREEVYIANVLKCRPPNNRDPSPDEVATCSPFLERQVAAIEPDVIVALGKFASNMLTGNDGSLGRIRGRWHEYRGVAVMPTYHPAYLLRSPDQKGKTWGDLKRVMKKLGLEIPEQYR